MDSPAPIIVTSGGCVCCKVRGDLISGISSLSAWRSLDQARLDAIIVEASGLAELNPILQTFFEQTVQEAVQLVCSVCVVDLGNIMMQSMGSSASSSAIAQVALADVVLLNKCDTVTANEIFEMAEVIQRRNPLVRIIKTQLSKHPELRLSMLRPLEHLPSSAKDFPISRALALCNDAPNARVAHEHDSWGSIVLHSSGEVDIELLASWLRSLLPPRNSPIVIAPQVYRGKGVIHSSAGPVAVQIVGTHIDISPFLGPLESNTLVLIGSAEFLGHPGESGLKYFSLFLSICYPSIIYQ